MRDVLAALQNLEHLLRSPRVGPKALTQIIHEIRPSCQPVGDLYRQLVEELAMRVDEPERVVPLTSFALARADRLIDSLRKASLSDMGARARLTLEAEVRVLRAELDAVRELIDLLDAATTFSATELDVNAIIAHALTVRVTADRRRSDAVRVAIRPCPKCDSMVSDPRVLMPLIALGVALSARQSAAGVEVSAAWEGSDAVVTFAPSASAPSDSLLCVPPRVVAPTLELTQLGAREVGISFDLTDDGRVQLRMPLGHRSSSAVRGAACVRDVQHS